MPNWVTNQVALKGTKQQMIELFNQVTKVNTWEDVENNIHTWELTMRSWLPMPQTFKDWDTTNDMEKFEWFCHDKNQPKEELRQEYEKYVRGYMAAREYQQETYGCVGWYDYNRKTLGCKWDAKLEDLHIARELGQDDVVVIYFRMDTAWSQPIPFLQHIAQYVNVVVRSDEEGGFFNNVCDINADTEIKDVSNEINSIYTKYEEENKDNDWEDWFEDYECERITILDDLDDFFYQYVIDLKLS